MKQTIYLLIAFFISINITYAQDCDIKTQDYIYVSNEEDVTDDIKKYIRFYDDGAVISTTSVFEIAAVSKWFNKKADDISIGEYEQAGCQMEFFTRNSSGKFYFKGNINEYGTLKMDVLYPSKKKKQMIEITYEFVKL